MSTAVPIIRGEGEGERLWFAGGGVHLWKATAEETGGVFILFEDRMQRGKTTPLHTHPHEDETFIVLEGEILVHVEGTEHPVGPGGFAVVPRGTRHAFLVTSETARCRRPEAARPFTWTRARRRPTRATRRGRRTWIA
jgi:homogentisate 1,2-dioxygenase